MPARVSDPVSFGRMLPVGLLLWLLIAGTFLGFLHRTPAEEETSIPVDAQIVELPPHHPAPSRPAPRPRPQPMPLPQAHPEPRPAAQPVEQPPPANASLTASARIAPRAIYRPVPKIPDDLRDEALHAEALARFHIRVDGTVTVELLKPTLFPRINQIIMDTLRAWRFFPALDHGQPVPSVQDIVIHVEVS